jgi:hypothetical protein
MLKSFFAETECHPDPIAFVAFRPSAEMEMLFLVFKQFPFGLAIGLTSLLFFKKL